MGLIETIRGWVAATTPMARFAAARAAAVQGKDAEAYRLFAPLLDGDHEELNLSRAEFGGVLVEVAECSLRLGLAAEAEGICRRGLSGSGPSRHTGALRLALAKALAAQQRGAEAAAELRVAVAAQRRAFGDASEAVARLSLEAAVELRSLGRAADAVRTIGRARRAAERVRPPTGHWRDSLLAHAVDWLWQVERRLAARGSIAALRRLAGGLPPKGRPADAATLWLALADRCLRAGLAQEAEAVVVRAQAAVDKLSASAADVRVRCAVLRGAIDIELGHHESAAERFRAAAALAGDDPRHSVLLRDNLGFALFRAGRREEGERSMLDALAEARGTRYEASALHGLAEVALAAGDHAVAEERARAAIALYPAAADEMNLARAHRTRAEALTATHRHAQSADAYAAADRTSSRMLRDDHPFRASCRLAAARERELADRVGDDPGA